MGGLVQDPPGARHRPKLLFQSRYAWPFSRFFLSTSDSTSNLHTVQVVFHAAPIRSGHKHLNRCVTAVTHYYYIIYTEESAGIRSTVARILPVMKRTKRRPPRMRVIRSWKETRRLLE